MDVSRHRIRKEFSLAYTIFGFIILASCFFALPSFALAQTTETTYFSWGVESETTSLGPIYGYQGGTTRNCTVAHSGSCSMRLQVIGNDGGNQQMGAELDLNQYPFNLVGGPAVYYRWWMRIDPGFSWGTGTAKAKANRVGGGPISSTGTFGRVYTGYVDHNGFLIGECDPECLLPDGSYNTDYNLIIPYDFRSKADGLWHEYIVKVKPNSSATCTVGAGGNCDAEFEAWVDGVSIGRVTGFKLHTNTSYSMVEGWGGWMAAPYFQLNGTASDGGVIYVDDFSTYTLGSSTPPPDTTAPTVSLTAPTAGTTVSGTVTVTATASDNVGIAGVQFRLDGTNLGAEDTTAPYSISWTTTGVTNGSHTITATARDAAGNTTTSSAVSVTVSNAPADTTAPSTPTNLTATAVSSSQINLSWSSATDNVGVTGYRVYRGGIQIASISATSYNDTGLTAGTTYSYTVQALDAAGNASAQSTAASAMTQAVTNSGNSECTSWSTSHPEWIFCDDFELTTPLLSTGRYFEYDDDAGDFVVMNSVGWNNSRSMRARWQTGEIDAGNLKLGFGGNPSSYTNTGIRSTENFRDVYYRMYVKMQSGWVGNPQKLSRATVITDSSWSQAMIAHLWEGSISGNTLGIDPVRCTDLNGNVVCSGYNDFSRMTWLGKQNGVTPVFSSPNVGQWQCIEAHTRLNDAGQSNGIQEFWVNGNLEARSANLNFVSSYSAYGINAIFFENYWNAGSPQTQDRYFDNIVVSTQPIGCIGITPPSPDTTAPTVSLSAPAGGTTVSGTVTVSATASDPAVAGQASTGVAGVQFRLDGVNLGAEDTTAPYSISWNTTSTTNGSHTLTALARDAAGNTTTSSAVSVTVNNVAADPTVSLSASPTSVTSGGSSTLTWSSANATSCTASGGTTGWSGTKATAGSQTLTNLTTTATYTLSCTGAGGTTARNASVTVTATTTTPPPSSGGGSTGGGSTSGGSTSGGTTGTTSGGGGGGSAPSSSTTSGGASTTTGDTSSSGTTTTGSAAGSTTSSGGTSTTATPLSTLAGPFAVGYQGSQVTLLQHMLSRGGFFTPTPTGYYGPITIAAVQKFQSVHGIITQGSPGTTGYGLAGPATRAKLNQLYATAGGGQAGISGGGATLTDPARLALIESLRKQIAELTKIVAELTVKLQAELAKRR